MADGQKTLRELVALGDTWGRHFVEQQWRELQVGDASGERFRALLQQLDRGGAEQQKLSRAGTLAPAAVDQPAQYLEQPREPLHLVQHDESTALRFEIKLRIG